MPIRSLPVSARRHHPAYFEYLFLAVGVTAACAVVVLVTGRWVVGALLSLVVAIEVVAVLEYRRRASRR